MNCPCEFCPDPGRFSFKAGECTARVFHRRLPPSLEAIQSCQAQQGSNEQDNTAITFHFRNSQRLFEAGTGHDNSPQRQFEPAPQQTEADLTSRVERRVPWSAL